MRKRLLVVFVAALAAAPVLTGAPMFIDTTWDSASGNWDVDTNWSTGNEPTAVDAVFINNGGTAEVTMPGEVSQNLFVGTLSASSGILRISGAGTLETVGLYVGGNGATSGIMIVSSGGQITQSGAATFQVGYDGGTGTALASGAGSLINWDGGGPSLGSSAGSAGTLTLVGGGEFRSTLTPLVLANGGATATVNVGMGAGAGILSADVTTGSGPGDASLNFNHTDAVTYAGVISGEVDVTKLGSGALTLTGANTHDTTVLQAGTLFVNGAQPLSSVTLQGGTLGGTGTVGDITATGGTVAPGLSPGILSSGNVVFSSATTFAVELDGATPGTGYDVLDVTGTVDLSDANFEADLNFVPAVGTEFVLIDNDGADPIVGTFDGLPEGAAGEGVQLTYQGGDGNDFAIVVIGAPVVAPGTLPTLTVGTPFTTTFTATGGLAPYTFSVSAGTVPDGLTLDGATGELSGTPTTAGPYSFTITATDSIGGTDEQAYAGDVFDTPVVAPGTLPDLTAGEPFSVTITATGGVAPYTFAVSAGALPAGLALDAATGELAGTPTTVGPYSFTITATDSISGTGAQVYAGDVDPMPVPSMPVAGLLALALLLAAVAYAKLRTVSA